MMSLKVYSWEVFERGKLWYIIFAVVIISLVALSLFYKSGDGFHWIFSAFLLLVIVGGYLFFLSKTNKEIEMTIMPEGLKVWDKLVPYQTLKGFVVEMEKKTWVLTTIVLVYEKYSEIYSLKDTEENQKIFFEELSKVIPFLEDYNQSTIDKLARKLKL